MADTHEEQLLSGLLRGIAREDAPLEARHLEPRVLASAFAGTEPGRGWTRRLSVIAAAAVVAALLPARFWFKADVRETARPSAIVATEEVIAEKPAVTVRKQSPAARPAQQPDLQKAKKEGLTPSADEFLPLMPMTEQELTGSFQIVRVQMPRASLGALRSPLEHPSEIVEADVLLGEDGMARAIRLSTGGSIQPWRSR